MITAMNEVFRNATTASARREARFDREHHMRPVDKSLREEAERALRSEFARRIFL